MFWSTISIARLGRCWTLTVIRQVGFAQVDGLLIRRSNKGVAGTS
jgi:hypothetical protein